MKNSYHVYIMANSHNNVLYTGVTSDLEHRVLIHRSGQGGAFTKKYQTHKLVYAEPFDDVHEAIAREKQIKAGSRKRKVRLITSANPLWQDLL